MEPTVVPWSEVLARGLRLLEDPEMIKVLGRISDAVERLEALGYLPPSWVDRIPEADAGRWLEIVTTKLAIEARKTFPTATPAACKVLAHTLNCVGTFNRLLRRAA